MSRRAVAPAPDRLGVFSMPEPSLPESSNAAASQPLRVKTVQRTEERSHRLRELVTDTLMIGPVMGATRRRVSIGAGAVAFVLVGMVLAPALGGTDPAPVDAVPAGLVLTSPDAPVASTPLPSIQSRPLAPTTTLPTTSISLAPPTTIADITPTTEAPRVLGKGTLSQND